MKPFKSHRAHSERTNGSAALALADKLYSEMVTVMDSLPQIRQEDFNLGEVKAQIVLPVAQYLAHFGANSDFVKVLFVSGVPGIGKTTLPMILDEALTHL